MGVQVDQSGRDDRAGGVDHHLGLGRVDGFGDPRHSVALHGDVEHGVHIVAGVEHASALDQQIVSLRA